MWVLQGPFDAVEEGQPKSKLLKPGKTYIIGRKAPADIIIAAKTVSREAAKLTIGPPTSADPHARPTVTLIPASKPLRIIRAADFDRYRSSEGFVGEQIEEGKGAELKAGDLFVLARQVGAPLLTWAPMAWCLDRRRIKEPELGRYVAKAAELGIPVMSDKRVPGPGWTHWVTASTGFTPSTLLAVCNAAWVVTRGYMDEVLRLGSLEASDAASLEATFNLPDASAYMPPITTELDAGLTPATFAERIQPDPQRPTLFRGTTMVLVHDPRLGKEGFLQGAVDLAKASGAAAVEECDVTQVQLDSAASVARYLRPILGRATSALAAAGDEAVHAPDGGLVVLVVEPAYCQTEEWYGHLARCTRELEIRMPDAGSSSVAQSVIHATPRVFLNSLASLPGPPSTDVDMGAAPATAEGAAAQPTPGFLPAASGLTANGEQAPPPTGSTILPTPAATPAAPAEQAPAANEAAADTGAAPKPLRRRAAAGARRDPLDDLFGSSGALSSATPATRASPPKAALPESQISTAEDPALSLQPQGLKRRARTARAEDVWDALLGGGEGGGGGAESSANALTSGTQGYASKSAKYRQELEEADARAQSEQPATQAPHESSELSAAHSRGQHKRPVSEREAEGDTDMADAEGPAAKRGRIATDNDEEDEDGAPPASNDSVGATPRPAVVRENGRREATSAKPGKDTKFLQALATQRNSKKADNFDREFDRLNIAVGGRKKGAKGGKAAAELATTTGLDDEDDDQGYMLFRDMALDDLDLDSRQGFIQVDFVSLLRKDKAPVASSGAADPRPNFKKFRKVRPNTGGGGGAATSVDRWAPRRAIDLDLAQPGDDFGLGQDGEGVSTATGRAPRIKVALDEDEEGGGDATVVELMAPPPKGGHRSIFAELSESEEEEQGSTPVPKRGGGADPAAKSRSTKASTRTTTKGTKGRKASAPARSRKPIRLDEDEDEEQGESDDDDVDVRIDDDDGDDMGVPSRGKGRSAPAGRGSKRTASAMDLEDDGMDDSFANPGGARKARGGKAARAGRAARDEDDDEDDEDDDGDFAGFGGTRTPSRRAARARKGRGV